MISAYLPLLATLTLTLTAAVAAVRNLAHTARAA